MAERLNRDPTYDLTRHIVTGEKGPLSGDSNLRQFDAELDRNDPMDPMTAGVGDNFVTPKSAAAVQQANLTQAMGMDTGDGRKDQEPVDMAAASGCFDSPDKGGLSYGPKNTGGY
jgi:hypothetical protein